MALRVLVLCLRPYVQRGARLAPAVMGTRVGRRMSLATQTPIVTALIEEASHPAVAALDAESFHMALAVLVGLHLVLWTLNGESVVFSHLGLAPLDWPRLLLVVPTLYAESYLRWRSRRRSTQSRRPSPRATRS